MMNRSNTTRRARLSEAEGGRQRQSAARRKAIVCELLRGAQSARFPRAADAESRYCVDGKLPAQNRRARAARRKGRVVIDRTRAACKQDCIPRTRPSRRLQRPMRQRSAVCSRINIRRECLRGQSSFGAAMKFATSNSINLSGAAIRSDSPTPEQRPQASPGELASGRPGRPFIIVSFRGRARATN